MKQPAVVEKLNTMTKSNIDERNSLSDNDIRKLTRNCIASSLRSPRRHKKFINMSASKRNIIESSTRTTTRDLEKKQSGDGEVEYPNYYSENNDEHMKTQRMKQDETDEISNERIIRQISNGSILGDDLFATDGSRFTRLFANEDFHDKNLNDAGSLKPWEDDRPVITQLDDDNAISYATTYLPMLADQKIKPGNLYYIPDLPQEGLAFDQLQETIDQPEKNVSVEEIEFGNPIDSYTDLTQILTTDENNIFDSQHEAEGIFSEVPQYQNHLNVPHLYVNLSDRPGVVKPKEVEILYPVEPYVKTLTGSSTSAPHFFRKVPGALNVYVIDERNGRPVIAPATEYVYPIVSMNQPMHKVNEHSSVISQSVPGRPVEAILFSEKEQNRHESNTVSDYNVGEQKKMIGKDHNMEKEAAQIFYARHKNKTKEGSGSSKMMHNDRSFVTTTRTTTVKGGDSQRANVSTMLNETKEVANQILEKIMDELEEIRSDRPDNEQIEGNYQEFLIFKILLSLLIDFTIYKNFEICFKA